MRFSFTSLILSALIADVAAAQDRVSELEDDVNAAGFTRRSMPLRIGAEAGMGAVGGLLPWGLDAAWEAIGDEPSTLVRSVEFLAMPALMTTGVWLGGRWTGGRGHYGWSLLGSYVGGVAGFASGTAILLLSGLAPFLSPKDYSPPDGTELSFVLAYTLPLIGAIVGYELSDHSATEKLKDKRKGALKSAEEPLMFHLMTLPF